MKVRKLMSQALATCRTHDTLERAAQLMWERDIGAVPVVDDEGCVVGIVTDRDICMATYTRGAPPAAIGVGAAMATHVHTCAPDDSLKDVEQQMARHQVRRMPVVDDDGRPVGMISINDIARAAGRDVTPSEITATLAAVSAPRSSPAA
ncbi:MAG: CBS domain-containing protein [Deltaproteobacteria bacterium]|nr:CBS domain-containing protein [Deltaproteobacteria bacterium]